MSIFETSSIDAEDSALILEAVASYVLKYNSTNYRDNMRLLLEFWHPRLIEKGVAISTNLLDDHTTISDVMEKIRSMEWNGSPEWDRDFFEGFFDATATMERRRASIRAELSAKPRFREFLEGDLHGQKIQLGPHSLSSLMRTSSLFFMEIKPKENLEKYLRGVFSGGRPIRYGSELWVSVRGAVKPVFDRVGIVYERGTRNSLMVAPFYIMLFIDDMPEPIASFWREKLGKNNHRNATVVSWMHWEIIYGRKKRRFLNAFPYMKSPQGCNKIGIKLDEVRTKMERHRFDHVDARINRHLMNWIEKQKDEDDDKHDNQTPESIQSEG